MENTWGHFDGRSDNCLYDLALRIAARVGTGTVQRIKAEMGALQLMTIGAGEAAILSPSRLCFVLLGIAGASAAFRPRAGADRGSGEG
jgi:hypothetical protein